MGYLKLVAFAYEGGSRRASFDGLGGGGGGVVERRVVLSWKAPECSGTARFNLNSAGSRNSSRRYDGQSSLSRALNTVLQKLSSML